MDYDTPSFSFLQIFFIGERRIIGTFLLHGLLTDFHGFDLTAIG